MQAGRLVRSQSEKTDQTSLTLFWSVMKTRDKTKSRFVISGENVICQKSFPHVKSAIAPWAWSLIDVFPTRFGNICFNPKEEVSFSPKENIYC